MNANQDEIITVTKTAKLGKIVKIKLSYKQKSQVIDSIKITGDFFLHPEETIENLERGLVGIKLEKDELENKIYLLLKNSEFYGFDADSLAGLIFNTKYEQNEI